MQLDRLIVADSSNNETQWMDTRYILSFNFILIACPINIKAHTCSFYPLKLFSPYPKEAKQLLMAAEMFLQWGELRKGIIVTEQKYTPLYEKEQNEREKLQWRLLFEDKSFK